MNNLIKCNTSKTYPSLHVKKYKNKVFYDGLWTDELLEARGHVALEDGTVVSRPFTKIFNRFENGVDILPERVCLAVEKINGFMMCATYVEHGINDVVISTTGSLDSKYVDYAKEFVDDKFIEAVTKLKGYSLLFEVCHPLDPHIIEEMPGLYLIGIRDVASEHSYMSNEWNETLMDIVAAAIRIRRPYWFKATFNEIVSSAIASENEGYVVYDEVSNTVLKLKSPHYKILKTIARVKDVTKINRDKLGVLPLKYAKLLEHVQSNVLFKSLAEQERLTYMREYLHELWEASHDYIIH